MKKFAVLLLLLGITLFLACEAGDPVQDQLNLVKNQLLLRKVVAIGNSLTAGFQSAGLRKDFQQHSYPYYIAQQIGKAGDFQMPWIESPGVGTTSTGDPTTVATPLSFNPQTGSLEFTTYPITNVPGLLSNALLPRPYDDLAVPGAALNDLIAATTSANSSNPSNPFYDMILRNPNFGNMTMLQQAILLNPSLVILWIGNNDVLGAALNGTDNAAYITDQQTFASEFTQLLTELRTRLPNTAVVMGNIPYVTDIPYVNTLDIIFTPILRLGVTVPVPVVFDTHLQPVVFDTTGGPLYLPLLTEEQGVEHLLIPALTAYQQGIGVPDSAALVAMGIPAPMASQLVQGMQAAGLNPTGVPIPASMTLTASEAANIKTAVDGFNSTLAGLATTFKVPIMDANSLLTTLNQSGIDGITGKFVLLDPANTGFSLDGVHPNNAGYAIVANEFIKLINANFGLSIPTLSPAQYAGQYVGTRISHIAPGTFEQVKKIFEHK